MLLPMQVSVIPSPLRYAERGGGAGVYKFSWEARMDIPSSRAALSISSSRLAAEWKPTSKMLGMLSHPVNMGHAPDVFF
jgi:hypothetical protein